MNAHAALKRKEQVNFNFNFHSSMHIIFKKKKRKEKSKYLIQTLEREKQPSQEEKKRLAWEEVELGMTLDALDISYYSYLENGIEAWFEAVVIKIEPKRIRIHYLGWGKSHDEWIKKDSFDWRIRSFSGKAMYGPRMVCFPFPFFLFLVQDTLKICKFPC